MTRDEMLAMKPGRELDELVIRHIMNIPVVESVDIFSQEPFPAAWWVEDEGWYIADERDEDGLIYRPFNPSEDISAAWEVVGKLQNDYVLDFKLERKYCVAEMKFVAVFEDLDGKKWVAHGWIAPEAICKAALLAVMDG